MANLKIDGRMKVKKLQEDFKKCFGSTLRVYNGNTFADPDATLASIRKKTKDGAKVGDFSASGNLQVGTFETKIKDNFGIKVQVATPDDKSLVDNKKTLSQSGK